MKITRKFNLNRIRPKLKYEAVTIESNQHDTAELCITEINQAWQEYKQAIKSGQVE